MAHAEERTTIGLDLGDKTSRDCVLDGAGQVIEEGRFGTAKKSDAGEICPARIVRRRLRSLRPCGLARN
jgi:hypothetical protein